jgi:hypothetical protein
MGGRVGVRRVRGSCAVVFGFAGDDNGPRETICGLGKRGSLVRRTVGVTLGVPVRQTAAYDYCRGAGAWLAPGGSPVFWGERAERAFSCGLDFRPWERSDP